MYRLTPLLLLALAGCQKADNQPGPGGVTVGEGRALDEAAARVERQSPPVPAPGPAPASDLRATSRP